MSINFSHFTYSMQNIYIYYQRWFIGAKLKMDVQEIKGALQAYISVLVDF